MKAVIDNRLWFGASGIIFDDPAQRLTSALCSERKHSRGSAENGRYRAGVEVVRRHHAMGAPLLDMAVTFDAAGQDKMASGVDFAFGLAKFRAQGGYFASGNPDLALHHVGGGSNHSVANNEIQLWHVSLANCIRFVSAISPRSSLQATRSAA